VDKKTLTRRNFAGLLAGTFATPGLIWAQKPTSYGKTALDSGVGPEFTCYQVDVAAASLAKRDSVRLPSNVQYAWPHPSRKFLYVSSSNGGPGIAGNQHFMSAFRIANSSGALQPHGNPIALR
jgi:6-phosphogluconolactonase